jgi:hypothetical protein
MPAVPAPAAKQGWKLLAGLVALLFVADLVAVVVLAVRDGEHHASAHEQQWLGHVSALAALIIFSAMIAYVRRVAVRRAQQQEGAGADAKPPPGILIGADNRLSTSKLSAFAWTWVLGWALLSLFLADCAGAHGGWDVFRHQGLQDEYLVVLGGPFLALVGAKALVSTSVANGSVVKTAADDAETTPAHRVAQAFSDDAGQTDLVDTQYLLFGSITLLVFVIDFLRNSAKGLPTLPETLIGLSSLGATAYIANKWSARDAKPKLENLVPAKGKRGAEVILYGTNLLTVSVGGKRVPAGSEVEVFFGALEKVEVDPQSESAKSSPSSDYVRLKVPYVPDAALPEGKANVEVTVRNAIGVSSENTLPFTIEA